MIRWLRSQFAWRQVRTAGVWAYFENGVTGARRADRINDGGWSPLDHDWLERRAPRARGWPPGSEGKAP